MIPRGVLVQKYEARGGMVEKNKFENLAKKTLNYFMEVVEKIWDFIKKFLSPWESSPNFLFAHVAGKE